MKIIHEPSIYVVGRQTIDESEMGRFLEANGVEWDSDSGVPGEIVAETAGRLCYMSYYSPRPGGNAAYLSHIKESGHGSVIEHAVWNFIFEGVSRSLTHELIRHRAGTGFSQLSQRYVDESVAEYVEPAIIAGDPQLHEIWMDAIEYAHASYLNLVESITARMGPQPIDCTRCDGEGKTGCHWDMASDTFRGGKKCYRCDGVGKLAPTLASILPPDASKTDRRKAARQAARSVLPNATETKIFVTMNARAIRHFLEQRGSRHADPEIRKLANRLLEVMQKESPNLFGDYRTEPLPDGTYEIVTEWSKV